MKLNLKGLGWIIILIFYVFLFFFLKGAFGVKDLGFVILILLLVSINLVIYIINRNYDKLKERLINQTLLLVTVLLLIVGSEIYLHVAKPPFLIMKNSITGEFQDFWDHGNFDASVLQKKPGTYRILGIGDSFAAYLHPEGYNYNDVLQKKLQTLPGGDHIEVVDAGIPCTGPGYYYNTMEKHGDLFKPDLVVVGIYQGNDFFEMRFDDKFIGQYISVPLQDRWWRYLTLKNYWIYQFLDKRLLLLAEFSRRDREFEQGLVKEKGSFSKAGFLRVQHAILWFFDKHNRQALNARFQQDAGVILRMKKWCDDRRIELVIAIFPAEIQVAPEMRQEILGDLKLKEESFDFDYTNTLLKNYLAEHGIRYVDLTGPMREAGKSKILYDLRNTHWNKEGNALAADIIFAYLQQQGLLRAAGIKE